MVTPNRSGIDDEGIRRVPGRGAPAPRPSADRLEEQAQAERPGPVYQPTADRMEQQIGAARAPVVARLGRDIERYVDSGVDRSRQPRFDEFDFSSTGAYRRAFTEVAQESGNEYFERFYRYEPAANALPANYSTPRSLAAQARVRRQNALALLSSSAPEVLDSFPTLRGIIADIPNLDEDDVRNLINLNEMETAWQSILKTGDYGAAEIYASMNPVQQAGFVDFVESRMGALFEEAQKDPSWFQQGFQYFMQYFLSPILDGLFWASETGQQTIRAQKMAIEGEGVTALSPFTWPSNVNQYWDSVAPNTFDEEKLSQLRVEHGGVVDVFVDLEVKLFDGLGNAQGRWMDNWIDTEYAYVIDEVINRQNENPDLISIARQVTMARTDRIGQMLLGSLPEDFLATDTASGIAGAINFASVVGLDPTIVGTKAVTTIRASRYAITKLAGPGGADTAFKYARTKNIFNALGRDLERVKRIEDPGKRAMARLKIDEQYGSQLPADVIDDLARFNGGIKNSNDAYEYFRASENMLDIAEGAPRPSFDQSELFTRLNAAQKGKRDVLIPGKTIAGVIRSNVRRTTAFMNPATKGDVARSSAFLPDDANELATVLMGSEYADVVGMTPRVTSELLKGSTVFGYKYSSRGVASRLDRLFRNWAKAPFNMVVDITSGKDATKVYQWSRAFLPRYHASIIADAFRNGNAGTRKRILNGLMNSSARVRGVQYRSPNDDMLRFSSESRRGRRYSPDIETITASNNTTRAIDRSPIDQGKINDFSRSRQEINFAEVDNVVDPTIGTTQVYGRTFEAPPGWVKDTFGQVDDANVGTVVESWARENGYSVVRFQSNNTARTVALPEMAAYGINEPAIAYAQALKQAKLTGRSDDDAYRIVTSNEIVPEIVLEQNIQSRSMSSFPNPNKPGEDIQLPIHLWQTSDNVALPNFNEIYEAGVNASVFGASLGWTHGIVSQKLVDAWSLFNLAGPRYFLRNATEDYIMYAMTSGKFANVQRGRRMSTALREARGQKLRGFDRVRSKKRKIDVDNIDVDLASRWSAVKASFSEEDLAKAQAALEAGDASEIRKIAAIALARMRFKGMDDVQTNYFLDYISLHGEKFIDEIAGTARYGSSAASPTLGRTAVLREQVDEQGNVVFTQAAKQYSDVSPAGADPLSFQYWHKSLLGAADRDGPIGKVTIANLDKADEEIIPLIVRALKDDEVTNAVGYKTRLASLNHPGETYETFARRYLADVRNLFSTRNGNFNRDLWEKVAVLDSDTGQRTVRMAKTDSANTSFAVEVSDLMDIPAGLRPNNIIGEAIQQQPIEGSRLARTTQTARSVFDLENWWKWMGDQYAVFAREPIFFANYMEARKGLAPLEAAWTAQFGEELARKKLANIATDRAYLNTLAYTDNPLDRTMLAWNARNVARYYRATEDFARRMLRVGKNYPVGFWKVALTYDTLEETGFVWSDSNEDKFFVFPGSDLAMQAIAAVLDVLPGNVRMMQFDNADFELRGMVRMIAPGTDPYQAIPSVSSPLVAFPVKSLISMFPALESFEQSILGEYSEGRNVWQSIVPGHIMRLWGAVDSDERSSVYASTIKDAMVIAAAADIVPKPDDSGAKKEKFLAELQTLTTTVMITKLLGGVVLNTSPRIGYNDVTKYARDQGFVDMDSNLKALIDKKTAEGAFNPVGEAMVDYVSIFGGNAAAYTQSKYKTGGLIGAYSGRASVPATEDARIWAISNNDLITNPEYRSGAVWLMPRTGEFSSDMWRYTINLGMRVPNSINEFYESLSGIKGKWLLQTTREENNERIEAAEQERYEAIINNDQNKIAEMDELIKRYEYDFEDVVKPRILAMYPYLSTQDLTIQTNSRVNTIVNEIQPTLDYVLNQRDKEPPQAAINMQEALDTFNNYIFEIDTIDGRTKDELFRKSGLRAELKSLLNDIGSQDDETRFFVENMLIPMVDRPEGYVSRVLDEGIVPRVKRILATGGRS
jgi:hypothetical protein